MDEDKKIGVLQRLLHSNTGRRAVVILGVAGIALIFLSTVLGGDGKRGSSASSAPASSAAADYAAQLEEKLTRMIGGIRGAGKAQVLVTLEQGEAQIYAKEEKRATRQESGGPNTDNAETGYILVRDADGNEHALPVTQQPPKVQGVVVTCPGASDPAVQQAVLQAVATAAGVSSARVFVAPSA